jgi:Fe-S-cluster containining protein
MVSNNSESWEVDWDLPFDVFNSRVKFIIDDALRKGKVIPLPIVVAPGMEFLNQITLLVSRVHCKDCNKCCTTSPCGNPIECMPVEGTILTRKYGNENFIQHKDSWQIKVPCGFLDSYGKCRIYNERPTVCVMYPFQIGAGDNNGNNLLALDSDCPEARIIALEIYIYRWYIRNQFRRNGTKIP